MSSSYIVEPQSDSEKKDDTLIIVVNDDGTLSVDQATLQNLIMTQSTANVSVVRLGQTETDIENGDITLTVDPPPFIHPTASSVSANASTDSGGLVDPFMEMDPEQLERLETALQSEEAKQILGENVTAMLDMLSIEEQQNTIRYNIQLDHCYTSRLSPNDPIPRDPLPIVDDSPESNDVQYIHQSLSPRTTVVSSINDIENAGVKSKLIVKSVSAPLQNKQMSRPIRKVTVSTPTNVPGLSRGNTNIVGTPKLSGHLAPRNITNVQHGITKAQGRNNEEEEDDDITESSTESSESEPPSDNDNDSDFGPRGTKRPNAKARGGRKGLTTRGGSMTAVRRRGQNKQLDMEQVRRLDMEMAAAVNAMKTPEKDERSERFSPTKSKRQIKTLGGKKKEESQYAETSPSEEVYEKPLQTTNQVKANLINANMIKGDMILTKPGQGRSNQKVTFVQKQIPMKPNELKNIGLKKPMMFLKGKPVNQTNTKLLTTTDGKLGPLPIASKTVSPNIQVSQVKATLTQQPVSQQSAQAVTQGLSVQQQSKISSSAGSPLKIKLGDIKREKRKSDSIELFSKGEENSAKSIENKALDGAKKLKKDIRKAPGFVADSLGPALFSTPDIIRRVGSNSDGKIADNTATPTTPTTPSATIVSTPGSSIIPISAATSLDIGICAGSNVAQNIASNFNNKKTVADMLEQSIQSQQLNLDESNNVVSGEESEQKSDIKAPLAELQPSLDSVPNTASSEGIIQPVVLPHVPNHIPKSSGIEGEEHLFATLEMEASKHEEELLAEALLLQDELTDDLAEHSALVDSTPPVSESLASNNMLMPTLITSDQELTKPTETVTTIQTQPNTPKEMSKKSKDDKEPIQIIRGGRVITLPPIEAPATRSKRLQAKTEISQKNPEPAKKIEKITPQVQQLLHNKEELKMNDEEEDDDEEDEEDNSDSEDDPDRLWCICKRPHNNRFMICCDVCEDWFHGKCVHVSKAMGQQMEEKGIEWVCPNCSKKKAEEERAKSNLQSGKQKTKIELVNENSISQKVLTKEISLSGLSVDGSITPVSGTMQCVVCKKEARNSSIYCSDACILAHAQETLTKDKPVPTGSKATKSGLAETKAKPETRVIVLDRKTGKLLTGADAPTKSNLQTWLKENPTCEVIGANNINTLKIGGKFVTQIQTAGKTVKMTPPVKVLPKMIYTKVVGSKQTVLAPTKKITIFSATQQQVNVSPSNKPMQLKQTIISTTPGRSPIILKTATPKSVMSAQLRATGSPKQTPVKKQETKPSPSQSKQQIKLTPVRKPETEPIRVNIRRTLTELLSSRIKETEDLKLTDEEIADLAFKIELEMYKYFKDTGSKYKAKYRSLVFNIKDTKNLTLFRKIADRSLTPDAVVRLSPDEMASQELAEWREKETKHQLEMIKKNELDLMAQAKSIVVKTHKGEQIIENDGGIDHVDPKTPVQDIVTALNSGDSISSTVDELEKDKEDKEDKEDRLRSRMDMKKSKMDERRRKDKERSRERDSVKSKSKDRRDRSHSRHRRSRDRDRSKTRDKSKERKSRNKESRRDKERERDKDKDRDRKDKTSRKESRERGRQKEKDKHKSNDGRMRNRSESREPKDIDKKEEERKKETEKKKETSPFAEKPIEDRLWRHIEDEATTNTIDGNDSDISDREPSSTVTIKTPDINEEPERDKEQETDKDTTSKGGWRTVWRGFVNMVDVAKFFITAQEVSGNAKDLMDDLPDTVDVVGRISHDTVWDYISKMKRTGSKEILVIRLTAANDEEKIPYITLYSYLNSRSRLGVVGNVSKNIKDFYIMPFSSQSTIPPVLLPLTGPGFEEHRPHLLLGIIVRNKKKRLTAVPPVVPTKTPKKESIDRSYTPPLVSVPKEKTSSPPPSSSPMLYHKATALTDSTKEKPTVTQLTLESLNKAHIGMSRAAIDTATICKIVPELSSKIDLTSSPGKVALDDDGDEPYSPGEMDDDMNNLQTTTDSAAGILSSSKNSTELQRKMDELNRQIEEQKQQIEEQKQQIQSISSSFLDETTPTLPGLGLDPPSNDCEEAYSPSDTRSFTPPPPGISKFAQPILDKVSDITIPPNLQEILANVKRQESSKVDPYLPSKPSASFLPATGSSLYASNTERYSPSSSRITQSEKASPEVPKESKSTLSTLSDLDLIRKAEEELAAVAAATAAAAASTMPSLSASSPSPSSLLASPVPNLVLSPSSVGSVNDAPIPPLPQALPSLPSEPVEASYKPTPSDLFKKSYASEQPKPPGLEDEDFPAFPSTPPIDVSKATSHSKTSSKTGIVLNVKRKLSGGGTSPPSAKLPRTKSRWGQGPSE